MNTSYQHLTDLELIKYAMIDAPAGSLAHLLAQRYEDNATIVASLEEEHASMIDDLERTHTCDLDEIKGERDDAIKRVKDLEKQLEAIDAALLK